MLDKSILLELYEGKTKSMKEISEILHCSLHKVAYWMKKYGIQIRSRSQATYLKRNPRGDPFCFQYPNDVEDIKLFGLGIGLYWGEGTKANKNSVRLGNTNPEIIKSFMHFLLQIFNIDKNKLRFGLQIFSDINTEEALDFWIKELNIHRGQINKPVITKSGAVGTYRQKSQYGVMTIMYHNKKLRDLLISLLPM